MFESHTTPENLIPGALLHGRLDQPDGAPVYGRLGTDGTVHLYTDCTWHPYFLKGLHNLVTQGHDGVSAGGPYSYTGITKIVTWVQARARTVHRQDADCAAFLDDGACLACGVTHAEDPEPCCGGRAFHRNTCVHAA